MDDNTKFPCVNERIQQVQPEYDSLANIMPKTHDSDPGNKLLVLI